MAKNNNFSNNKAIGPVVAVALLLVVAVIAVVGFQTWFNNYQSSLQSNSEIRTNQVVDGSLEIDEFDGRTIYIRNNIEDNLSIIKLKIVDTECSLNQNLTLGMNSIDVSSCTGTATDITDITLITQDKVIQKKFFVKNIARLDCSNLNSGEWVLVPGNPTLGTNDFCVMKYEAKEDSSGLCPDGDSANCPVSEASGTPWVNINQTDAIVECESLGPGYHLLSDPQWVTIARNIEQVDANWDSGITYTGSLKRGNTGDNVAGIAYDGSNPADRSIDTNTLALLNLSNGVGIWDLSGNVWEWTSDTLPTTGVLNSSLGLGTGEGYAQWNTIPAEYDYLKSFNTSLTSVNGIGQVYYDGNTAWTSGDVHGFLRGGYWGIGARAGAFALYLRDAPSSSDNDLGFRCSFEP